MGCSLHTNTPLGLNILGLNYIITELVILGAKHDSHATFLWLLKVRLWGKHPDRNLQLLARFKGKVPFPDIIMLAVIIEYLPASGINYFKLNSIQVRSSTNSNSVLSAGIEGLIQLCFFSLNQQGSMVITVVLVGLKPGFACVFSKLLALCI